jgi:hypothetical protein
VYCEDLCWLWVYLCARGVCFASRSVGEWKTRRLLTAGPQWFAVFALLYESFAQFASLTCYAVKPTISLRLTCCSSGAARQRELQLLCRHGRNLQLHNMKGIVVSWPTWPATSSHILYGDFLNAVLYSLILPFVTIDVFQRGLLPLLGQAELFTTFYTAPVRADLSSDKLTLGTADALRLLLQWLFGLLSVLFDALAFYKSLRDDSLQRHQDAMRWSYAGFVALMASCAALSINNLSHPGEATLLGHFCWNLVVAATNLPHSFRVKLIMGTANLLMGLVAMKCWPDIYPWKIYVPLLVGMTGT